MIKRLTSSILVIAASFLAPATASALPPDCDVSCDCYEPCTTKCTLPGTNKIITCGSTVYDWYLCVDRCAVEPPEDASTPPGAEYSEEEQLCREAS